MAENDFKYVIQDFSNVYIGARLTFDELTANDDAPQRLKTAIFRYVYESGQKDIRICDKLMTMEKGSPEYMIFMQLKSQVRIVIPVTKTDRKGNVKTEFKMDVYSFADFIDEIRNKSEVTAEQISEITFKKLQLMSLSV